MFPCNIQIANIMRIAGANRYGEPKRKVVAVDVWGCFSQSTTVIRNAEGNFSQIDANIKIYEETLTQDQITLKSGDIYEVVFVNEVLDAVGNIAFYDCQLRKQI